MKLLKLICRPMEMHGSRSVGSYLFGESAVQQLPPGYFANELLPGWGYHSLPSPSPQHFASFIVKRVHEPICVMNHRSLHVGVILHATAMKHTDASS